MNFTGKFNAGMASFAKSMKNNADNSKIDGKIAEQQKRIKALTKEIGNLAILRLEAGDQMCPEIMERYEAVLEAREMIQTLEQEKKVNKVVCPSCGKKTTMGMKYCGHCGAAMNEIVEE